MGGGLFNELPSTLVAEVYSSTTWLCFVCSAEHGEARGCSFWVHCRTWRVTAETNKCIHWPCCYIAVTNLSSSPKHTWLITATESCKEISLEGKRNQIDTDVSQSESCVVTHVNQVTIKESLYFTCMLISKSCLQLCLAVWMGVSSADCVQKYQCKIFYILHAQCTPWTFSYSI